MIRKNYNKNVFNSLFDTHYRELVNFTTFLIHDRAAAETVVINLFAKIWQFYQSRFCKFENIRSYLFCATYLEGKRYLKRVKTGWQMASGNIEYLSELNEPCDINQLFTKLPPVFEQIVRLIFFENLSLNQIAATLKINITDLKLYKKQAEDLLAVALHK